MALSEVAARECSLAAKYCGVGLIGFLVDLGVLHLMLRVGLEPAWARVISLLCAMHVTFATNGLHVFRQLDARRCVAQWARYMACNGVGNVCNFWIFVTLVSSRWPVIATPAFAVAAGSASAWAINFAATRFLVFPPCRPEQAAPAPQSDP
jgi:putative flippase GtrA